jgi:predicted dehydrogenase
VQVEDSASLQVVSATGVIGSLNCSWVTPVSEAEIRVWGTEGEAIIDYATNTGARYHLAGDHDWTVLPFELPDRFVLQAEHFLHCAHGNQPPRVSGADGIAVMHVIEAAYRSAQGNQTLVRP